MGVVGLKAQKRHYCYNFDGASMIREWGRGTFNHWATLRVQDEKEEKRTAMCKLFESKE